MFILGRYPEPREQSPATEARKPARESVSEKGSFGPTRKRDLMDQSTPDEKKKHVGSNTYDERESIRHPIIKPCNHMRIQGRNVSFEKKIVETLRPPTITVHRLLRHRPA